MAKIKDRDHKPGDIVAVGEFSPLHKNCRVEYVYTNGNGIRGFMCTEHQTWTYQHPIANTFEY